MNDLDLEITRLDIKKKIIVEEMRGNMNTMREDLTFPNMILNMIGVEVSENVRSKIYTVFRAAVIIFTTIRGGKKILRAISNIFK
jgi:hypothetical protein